MSLPSALDAHSNRSQHARAALESLLTTSHETDQLEVTTLLSIQDQRYGTNVVALAGNFDSCSYVVDEIQRRMEDGCTVADAMYRTFDSDKEYLLSHVGSEVPELDEGSTVSARSSSIATRISTSLAARFYRFFTKRKSNLPLEELRLKSAFGYKNKHVKALQLLGYSREIAIQALIENHSDLHRAANALGKQHGSSGGKQS